MPPPSRAEAQATLDRGQAALDEVFGKLTDDQLSQPGTLYGGAWAAKDLMGHVAYWEELALETLDAWRAGRRPPVEDIFQRSEVDQVNARNQAATAAQAVAEIRARAASTHQALVAAIQSLSEAEWESAAPYPDASQPSLGDLLGGVLGAPQQPFGHALAHAADLQAVLRPRP